MSEIDIGNPNYTTFTKLLQVRNFITFELKVIRHVERETQSFSADYFYICPKPRAAPHLQTTGLASVSPESQPSLRTQEVNSLLFLKFQKSSAHASGTWRHSSPLVPFLSGVLFWHLWMTHPPRARVNTCAQLTHALTHPCTTQKVLSLTKPKGKVYKTRSIRNYITFLFYLHLGVNCWIDGCL